MKALWILVVACGRVEPPVRTASAVDACAAIRTRAATALADAAIEVADSTPGESRATRSRPCPLAEEDDACIAALKAAVAREPGVVARGEGRIAATGTGYLMTVELDGQRRELHATDEADVAAQLKQLQTQGAKIGNYQVRRGDDREGRVAELEVGVAGGRSVRVVRASLRLTGDETERPAALERIQQRVTAADLELMAFHVTPDGRAIFDLACP